MKKNAALFAILFCISTVQAQKQLITLEDIFQKGTFSGKGVAGFNSMKDGRYYCAQDSLQNLLRYEFASGKAVDTLIRKSELKLSADSKPIDFFSFEFSPDENKVMIPTEEEHLYRHSFKARYYVFDLKTRKLSQPVDDKILLADFSPDGDKFAYVKDNDLYYFNLLLNKNERITTDGKFNNIINGTTDWVYEEEFALWKAFYWNPKGDKIAFYRFDESKVKEFEMTMYGKLYPYPYTFKYPKAGEANSVVNVYVYDLASQQTAEMDIGKETDIYIPRIKWTSEANTLCITRLNRLQNKMELLLANAANGSSRVMYTEENKCYIDVPEIHFLANQKGFVLNSERNGWNHLYHFDMKGKLVKQISTGNFDVDAFYGLDEKTKTLFYSSSETMQGLNQSHQRYIYTIGMNGKNKKMLGPSNGWNTATFNSDFSFYLNTNSNINTPSSFALYNVAGQQVRMLEDNTKLKNKLNNYELGKLDFLEIKNSYGENLNAWILKPSNFNATDKYPVLMYAYNGPGHQLAVDRWMGANYYWFQMLAQKGYIVVCIDGRGTGAKGEAFKKCTYLQLGKYEIEDQIFCARQIGRWSFVDSTRIGFWGWSFGGYMASLAISKGADVFKTAIAIAPVTNWRYYDNIYTERFMRTPQENGESYDSNSPINHVDKIKGNYLIVHGTADDNVHFQNTVEMVDALIRKNKRFDSEFYPNKNHGIGARLHLYERMTRFLLEKL